MKFTVLVAPLNNPTVVNEDEIEAASANDLVTMYGMLGMKLVKILFADETQGNAKIQPLPKPGAANPVPANIDGSAPVLSVESQNEKPAIQSVQNALPAASQAKERIFTDGNNIYKIDSNGVMYKKDWDAIAEDSYRLMKSKSDGSLVEVKRDGIIVQMKCWKVIETKTLEGQ
jgi:hypothetical protein